MKIVGWKSAGYVTAGQKLVEILLLQTKKQRNLPFSYLQTLSVFSVNIYIKLLLH